MSIKFKLYGAFLLFAAAVAAYFFIIAFRDSPNNDIRDNPPANMSSNDNSIKVSSSSFANLGKLPAKFTCDKEGVNPALSFEGVPQGTKSLALVLEDPDAPSGTFYHWVAWNISPGQLSIEENTEPSGVAGTNSAGRTGYFGPCPPSGSHRYIFKVFALDTLLTIKDGSGAEDLYEAMRGRVLAEGAITALYGRGM